MAMWKDPILMMGCIVLIALAIIRIAWNRYHPSRADEPDERPSGIGSLWFRL